MKKRQEFWGIPVLLCIPFLWHATPQLVSDLTLQIWGVPSSAEVSSISEKRRHPTVGRRRATGMTFAQVSYRLQDEEGVTHDIVKSMPGSGGGVAVGQRIDVLYDPKDPQKFVDISSPGAWHGKIFRDALMVLLPALYLLYRAFAAGLFGRGDKHIEIYEGKPPSCCK